VSLKTFIKKLPLYQLKYHLERYKNNPVITKKSGELDSESAPATFIVICGPGFNQKIPNAATTSRIGWCNGFEQIGIPYQLVSVYDLAKTLPDIANPLCWISGSDYLFLNKKNLQALSKYKHIVWVSTYFKYDKNYYQERGLPNLSWDSPLRRKILSSNPSYLFTISSESKFEFYQGWIEEGANLISLPLACDFTLFDKPNYLRKFDNVELAFVVVYWDYKAIEFNKYLKPYEQRLTVFGYSKWPYARYGGLLSESDEPSLYKQARLSPIINEPHVSAMGIDVNERVFKVLGSGGLGLTDAVNIYRDWFNKDELLIPESEEEYHFLVKSILNEPEKFAKYREAGKNAVVKRHTYAHRAVKLCSLLGVNISDKIVCTYKQ